MLQHIRASMRQGRPVRLNSAPARQESLQDQDECQTVASIAPLFSPPREVLATDGCLHSQTDLSPKRGLAPGQQLVPRCTDIRHGRSHKSDPPKSTWKFPFHNIVRYPERRISNHHLDLFDSHRPTWLQACASRRRSAGIAYRRPRTPKIHFPDRRFTAPTAQEPGCENRDYVSHTLRQRG